MIAIALILKTKIEVADISIFHVIQRFTIQNDDDTNRFDTLQY